jgi:hypothetical protein
MGDIDYQEQISSWDVTGDEVAALVSEIDRALIVDLVKRSKYLQKVFHGFRPSKLPWAQVPKRLAREVESDPSRLGQLVSLWVESNQDLLDQVSDISLDRLRESIAELLARRGVEDKFQVLWALRLDERDQVQQALAAGLSEEISAETSELLSLAQGKVLAVALETAQMQVAGLKRQLKEAEADLEDNQRLLQHKNEQLGESQAQVSKLKAELEGKKAELEAGHKEWDRVRKQLEQELRDVQRELDDEQAISIELHQSVQDLKATLQAQVASSSQEETQQKLDKALLDLEQEHKESARLRLQVDGLRRDLEDTYTKRDEARDQNKVIVQKQKRLEYDKEVLIKQKRGLAQKLETIERERSDLHRQLQEQIVQETLTASPLSELEERWADERDAIRDYMRELIHSLSVEGEASSSEIDKERLWSQWLEREAALVHSIVTALDGSVDLDAVNELEDAQQLLTLRWYLLEYTRQAILLALQESAFIM